MKKVIRINEQALRKIIKEAVLKEMNLPGLRSDFKNYDWSKKIKHHEKLHTNPEYLKNWKNSMYDYWREEGLSDEEIDEKIRQALERDEDFETNKPFYNFSDKEKKRLEGLL